jgi:hypothetical protein
MDWSDWWFMERERLCLDAGFPQGCLVRLIAQPHSAKFPCGDRLAVGQASEYHCKVGRLGERCYTQVGYVAVTFPRGLHGHLLGKLRDISNSAITLVMLAWKSTFGMKS